jgi:hypothetical protein
MCLYLGHCTLVRLIVSVICRSGYAKGVGNLSLAQACLGENFATVLSEHRSMISQFERCGAVARRASDRMILAGMGVFHCFEQANRFDVRIFPNVGKIDHRHAWDVGAIAEFNPLAGLMTRRRFRDEPVQKRKPRRPLAQQEKAGISDQIITTNEGEEILPVLVGIRHDACKAVYSAERLSFAYLDACIAGLAFRRFERGAGEGLHEIAFEIAKPDILSKMTDGA